MTQVLTVHLGEEAIGTLTMLASGSVFFQFDETYQRQDKPPVLSQSFYRPDGSLIVESKATRVQLPPFFSNLLPEGHMRDYLAERGGIKPTNEFGLLQLLGEDLPGAVRITVETPLPVDHAHQCEPDDDKAFHFSLAGVQLKFSAIAGKHGGLTIPAHGVGGDWIVKLPAQNYANVPENEYAMMQLAQAIGIPIPEIRLVPLTDIGNLPEMGVLAGKQALAVKRFDRPALSASDGKSQAGRIHIEDFAQVYNVYPHKKYEGVSHANMAGMVWLLTGEAGLVDYIRRLTFSVLIGNGDMHLKNWSLIYRDGRTPALSPAYDLLSSIPYIPGDGMALNLGDTKNMHQIGLRQFEKLAKKAQIPAHLVQQTVRNTAEAALNAWQEHGKQYGLPDKIFERIDSHLHSVPLGKL